MANNYGNKMNPISNNYSSVVNYLREKVNNLPGFVKGGLAALTALAVIGTYQPVSKANETYLKNNKANSVVEYKTSQSIEDKLSEENISIYLNSISDEINAITEERNLMQELNRSIYNELRNKRFQLEDIDGNRILRLRTYNGNDLINNNFNPILDPFKFYNSLNDSIESVILEKENIPSNAKLTYADIVYNNKIVGYIFNIVQPNSKINSDGNITCHKMPKGVQYFIDLPSKSSIGKKIEKNGKDKIRDIFPFIFPSQDEGYKLLMLGKKGKPVGWAAIQNSILDKFDIREIKKKMNGDAYYGIELVEFQRKRIREPKVIPQEPEEPQPEPTPQPEPIPQPEPTPQPPSYPIIPTPAPTNNLDNNIDPQDPVNTGIDPNTGDSSTPTDPVVNPDPEPHIF